MKLIKNKAFTLVELLVVITILSIISVVAYQNFGGAVDKANVGRKIWDVATIESALLQFKADKNFYPAVDVYDASTNMWGYNSGTVATPSNKLIVSYDGEEVNNITTANGGGAVYGTGTWQDTSASKKQIGAKGTISRDTLGKKYLSKDLYDPEVGDIKVNSTGKKLIDYGIGRYVYATFKKAKWTGEWSSNFTGQAYNLAFTVKKENSDKYITKIVGDYDEESCYDDKATCMTTLIWSGGKGQLVEWNEENEESNKDNFGVPYAISDFAAQP